MKAINIKGKPYIMVNERVKEFRENEKYADWSMTTEILTLTDDICCMRAVIADGEGRIVATGTAREEFSASQINKTSYVENCETSAIGRALGFLGIGIEAAIASAEEVVNAIKEQIDNPTGMSLRRAKQYTTKSGKKFVDLTYDELNHIMREASKEEYREAARVLMNELGNEELLPLGSEE